MVMRDLSTRTLNPISVEKPQPFRNFIT
uniref:Uncharacterized protein n=1 Tax=Rhizophora mucronata TaxID=61149 RepID=A0A2P2JPK1_RHIMU